MLIATACAFVVGISVEAMAAEEVGSGLFSKFQASRNADIVEVSPPEVIQELRSFLSSRQPQVQILSPKTDQVVKDSAVSVELQVKDLPIFRDAEFGLGPHLCLFVDDQPGQAIYDVLEPITVEELKPGTHTLRVLAVYPWSESFKNQGAYAEVTFHVFTKTRDNQPTATRPLLTYNQPQDSLGAEPVLLDFYLSSLFKEDTGSGQVNVLPGQVRVTVNDTSFFMEDWKSIYVEGLHPGKNWVRLELLDEKGDAIANAYNETVRLVDLQPNGQDSLAQIVRGDLTTSQVRGIVDPDYQPPAPVVEVSEPEPIVDEQSDLDTLESDAASPMESPSDLNPEEVDLSPNVGIEEKKEISLEVTPETPESSPEEATTSSETGMSSELDTFTE